MVVVTIKKILKVNLLYSILYNRVYNRIEHTMDNIEVIEIPIYYFVVSMVITEFIHYAITSIGLEMI